MKAAPISVKPDFELMTQKDIVTFYHLQMPRWLFFDGRYKDLSLESKVIYSFLLNRFQLSRLNNWINADGEIFIIYTRADLSTEIGVSYKKVIAGIKELAGANLIWERRCGRGDANQIYLARVEPREDDAIKHRSAPFSAHGDERAELRYAGLEHLEGGNTEDNPHCEEYPEDSRPAETAVLDDNGGGAPNQEVPKQQFKTCENGASRSAETARQDMRNRRPSYIDMNHTEKSDTDVSQSVCHCGRAREAPDGLADDLEGLEDVLQGCDLWIFPPETAKVFENAIERLWFSKRFRIGNAVLPQSKVRSHLHALDNIRLAEAERKISANTERVIKNSTAYVMAVVFNTIWETGSDIMTDPYLNSLRQDAGGGEP